MSSADLYGGCPGCGVNVDPAEHDCPCWRPGDGGQCSACGEVQEATRGTSKQLATEVVRERDALVAEVRDLRAKVARVEALAREMDHNDCPCECCRDDETPHSLRAALRGE